MMRRHFRGAAAISVNARLYTPIAEAAQPKNYASERTQRDEERALWASSVQVPTVAAGVEAFLRMGNDPVLHTSLPASFVDVVAAETSGKPNPTHCSSPFAYVEDYMGTNMVVGSKEQLRDSVTVWSSYFDRKYTGLMRQARRTVANHVGTVNAPETFVDEADRPETTWAQDSYFREVSFLSEKHLKERVTNLEQFERALMRSPAEAYNEFYEHFLQQTHTQIPLPSPSVWHYPPERVKAWAEKFCPLQHERNAFFEEKVIPAAKDQTPEKVVEKVGLAFAEVAKILKERYARQVQENTALCGEWSSMSAEDKKKRAAHEVELRYRSIADCDFDPEDTRDASEKWTAEQLAINEALSKEIDGLGFSAMEFWKHTIRFEEMETEHVHAEPRIRAISAAALEKLYDAASLQSVLDGTLESIQKGQLDTRAYVFRPHTNEVWCKLNYAKFGASSIAQHTSTASRVLQFHHAGSTGEVAAAASLYYKSKPLSKALDYSSPYKFRRSLATLCSTYGVDMMHALQRPHLLSAAHIARADNLVQTVVRVTGKPFGAQRRQETAQVRAANQRLLVPMKGCVVTSAAEDQVTEESNSAAPLSSHTPTETWLLGARQSVYYEWPIHHHERLKVLLSGGGDASLRTAQQVIDVAALKKRACCEVSLWRKRTADDIAAARTAEQAEASQVASLVNTLPQLREVKSYATAFFSRITGQTPSATASTESEDEWEFVTMLDDRGYMNVEQRVDVYLPFTDANGARIPQGEYRLRIHGFDLDSNPTFNASACVEAFTKPFVVFDAVPQLVGQFFSTQAGATEGGEVAIKTFPGKDLIAFCQFLRDAGVDVPMGLEFEAGQVLNENGDVFMERFLSLLHGDEFHHSGSNVGVTSFQREIEHKVRAHWGVHHPGATKEEWACSRRAELDHAAERERDWWFNDDMLEAKNASYGQTPRYDPSRHPSTCRYAASVCAVLKAEGRSNAEDRSVTKANPLDAHSLNARSTVDGTGAVTSMEFQMPVQSSGDITVDDALGIALSSIQSAQDRHNTLSAFKVGPYAKQSQAEIFCSTLGLEFGGKYARTYCYALNQAKKQLTEDALAGRAIETSDRDLGARVSEKLETDRFASADHPEMRRKRFTPTTGPGGYNMDDPQPSNTSNWGK